MPGEERVDQTSLSSIRRAASKAMASERAFSSAISCSYCFKRDSKTRVSRSLRAALKNARTGSSNTDRLIDSLGLHVDVLAATLFEFDFQTGLFMS